MINSVIIHWQSHWISVKISRLLSSQH